MGCDPLGQLRAMLVEGEGGYFVCWIIIRASGQIIPVATLGFWSEGQNALGLLVVIKTHTDQLN